LHQARRRSPGDRGLRSALALERRYQLEQERLHAVGAENFHCGSPFEFQLSPTTVTRGVHFLRKELFREGDGCRIKPGNNRIVGHSASISTRPFSTVVL